jgi:hypothetical protein
MAECAQLARAVRQALLVASLLTAVDFLISYCCPAVRRDAIAWPSPAFPLPKFPDFPCGVAHGWRAVENPADCVAALVSVSELGCAAGMWQAFAACKSPCPCSMLHARGGPEAFLGLSRQAGGQPDAHGTDFLAGWLALPASAGQGAHWGQSTQDKDGARYGLAWRDGKARMV